MHLGQGLHTLEDLYAHSNFCELTLRAHGIDVYPWAGTQRAGVFPLLTGKFGATDAAASIFLAIAEELGRAESQCGDFATIWREERHGTFTQTHTLSPSLKIAFILAKDFGQNRLWARFLEPTQRGLEQVLFETPIVTWMACNIVGWISELCRHAIGFAIHHVASLIDDAETAFFDETSTDNPTHSQLAKDHDDHPLHVPAALAARTAARWVGTGMIDVWAGRRRLEHVLSLASSFFVHPAFITNQSPEGVREVRQWIIAWAGRNAGTIRRLPSGSDLRALRGWGHAIGDHANAVVDDPAGYLDRRIHDFHEIRRQLARTARERELADPFLRDLQRIYQEVLQGARP